MHGDRNVERAGVQGQPIGQIPDRGLGRGDGFVLADVGPDRVAGGAHPSAQLGGGEQREGVPKNPVHLGFTLRLRRWGSADQVPSLYRDGSRGAMPLKSSE